MTDAEGWDARYRAREPGSRPPEPFLVSCEPTLPGAGRAIDVGGGDGRHAVWLAARGLDVTVVDVSAEALSRARANAAAAGVAIRTVQADLEVAPLPPGPWDLVVMTFFLDRVVLHGVHEALAPGGLLVVAHPTRRNLERNPHPSARWLLDEGELPGLVPGVDVIRYEEGWTDGGQHLARLLARRG